MYDPCPYCGATIRVEDDRPNTTDAFRERIERERSERPPAQESNELQTLLELRRLRTKAVRVAVWIAVLLAAVVLSLCALRLLVSWLRQDDGAAAKTLIGAGVFGALSVAAWIAEGITRRRARRTGGIFRR